MSRILVIEDNEDLAFGLRKTLEFEGCEVDVAEDGLTGLERARTTTPDLVVLDLMLPGLDGFEVLRALRGNGDGLPLPVLILTARGDETDVVRGFELGADDYVTKPFSTLELIARVKALLRRGGDLEDTSGVESFGDVEIDTASRTVRRSDGEVQLTPKEFDLLVAPVRRRGAVASRADLLGEVWRYPNANVPTRTVDIHVAELRRKLEEDPSAPRHILTVRKAGYRLEE